MCWQIWSTSNPDRSSDDLPCNPMTRLQKTGRGAKPILNKITKARNYTLETVNRNIYIFGIAMNAEEKKEVINEANKIYDVEEIIPSIYLASELSRTKI